MPIDFPDTPGLTPTYQYTYNGITQNWYWGFSGGSGVSAWLASGFSITSAGDVIGSIYDLDNVTGQNYNFGIPTNYVVFKYDHSNSSWTPDLINIADLEGVIISSPTQNEVLTYQSGQWGAAEIPSVIFGEVTGGGAGMTKAPKLAIVAGDGSVTVTGITSDAGITISITAGGGGGGGNQGFQGVTGPTGVQGFQGHTGFQGFQGTTGPTGIIGSIFINNDEYTNQESIKFFSDHSITYSSASNILTITFGSELGTISGNAKDSGIAKWTYTVFDTSFDGSSWITGNSSVNGYNLLEVNNTSTIAYATSVTGSEGITLAGFTGFAVQPVPDGTKVELIYQSGTYFFSAPNPVTGEC